MKIDPRNGAAKRPTLTPPVHDGMTEQQRKMTGMGHPIAGAPDASSANPLDPTALGKRLTPPTIHPSMKHSSVEDFIMREQSGRVINEAIDGSKDSQHPARFGRKS
jgi:hypothetical protein